MSAASNFEVKWQLLEDRDRKLPTGQMSVLLWLDSETSKPSVQAARVMLPDRGDHAASTLTFCDGTVLVDLVVDGRVLGLEFLGKIQSRKEVEELMNFAADHGEEHLVGIAIATAMVNWNAIERVADYISSDPCLVDPERPWEQSRGDPLGELVP